MMNNTKNIGTVGLKALLRIFFATVTMLFIMIKLVPEPVWKHLDCDGIELAEKSCEKECESEKKDNNKKKSEADDFLHDLLGHFDFAEKSMAYNFEHHIDSEYSTDLETLTPPPKLS